MKGKHAKKNILSRRKTKWDIIIAEAYVGEQSGDDFNSSEVVAYLKSGWEPMSMVTNLGEIYVLLRKKVSK